MEQIITPEVVQGAIALFFTVLSGVAAVGVRALSRYVGPAGTALAEQAIELANDRIKRGIENEAVRRGYLEPTADLIKDRMEAMSIANDVAVQMPETVETLKGSVSQIANVVPGVLANMAAKAAINSIIK